MKINESTMFSFDLESNKGLDSIDEVYFNWFLLELEHYGFIENIKLQPDSFKMSDKKIVKYYDNSNTSKKKKIVKNLKLDPGRVYTADSYCVWNDKAKNIFHFCIDECHDDMVYEHNLKKIPFVSNKYKNDKYISYFEVKPSFDRNNMTRLVKNNISFIYYRYGILINLVIKEKLFEKFCTPERYLYTDLKKRKRKLNFEPILIKDFVNEKNKRSL